MWESFAILEEPKNWQGWEKEMALVMTKEWIRQQCRKYRQFQTPALNDKLYLQNQGFSEIQNLEEYTVSFHSLNVTYSMRAFRSLNVTHSLEVSVRLWSIEGYHSRWFAIVWSVQVTVKQTLHLMKLLFPTISSQKIEYLSILVCIGHRPGNRTLSSRKFVISCVSFRPINNSMANSISTADLIARCLDSKALVSRELHVYDSQRLVRFKRYWW